MQRKQLLGQFDLQPFACEAPHASQEPKIIAKHFQGRTYIKVSNKFYAYAKCQKYQKKFALSPLRTLILSKNKAPIFIHHTSHYCSIFVFPFFVKHMVKRGIYNSFCILKGLYSPICFCLRPIHNSIHYSKQGIVWVTF